MEFVLNIIEGQEGCKDTIIEYNEAVDRCSHEGIQNYGICIEVWLPPKAYRY